MPPHDFSQGKSQGVTGPCIWGCGTSYSPATKDEECPKHPRTKTRPIPVSLKATDISARIAELRKEKEEWIKGQSDFYDPSGD